MANFSLALCVSLLCAAPPPENAVFGAFKQADASLSHFAQVNRTSVTEDLDLILAIGSPQVFAPEPHGMIWTPDRKIGLFLQEKNRPERVYFLGAKSGFQDCYAYIERVTATDTVISCHGEKPSQYPNQKWVYDVRARSLLRQFSYEPFAMYRIFSKAGGAVFLGTDRQKLVAIEYNPKEEPALRVLSAAAVQPWARRVHVVAAWEGLPRHDFIYIEAHKVPLPNDVPSLPPTTYDQFAAARPQRVRDGYVRQGTELEEAIGPWQREGERIWFGKTFYDGEGVTGVGGFGYFDKIENKLRLFNPPEIADWSISALDVTLGAVWMALIHNGEYGGSSGGLLRYDRRTAGLSRIPLPDIATGLSHIDGKIIVATDFGLAIVDGDRITRFFVDQTTDGRLRIVPATR